MAEFLKEELKTQTAPKCSQLKYQKSGVIDESPPDMDTLLIDDMYFL